MRDWLAMGISFFLLFIIAVLIMVVAWGSANFAVKAYDPQPDITERYEHCLMVWGDSDYFDSCMRWVDNHSPVW